MVPADDEPGDYFVSVYRGGSGFRAVSGPYRDHGSALAAVDACRAMCGRLDPWTDFDAFGTLRLRLGSGVVGVLQRSGLLEAPGG